ncbi:MAG: hypothetical protein AABY93_17345 [Bacteroidota bacterium]
MKTKITSSLSTIFKSLCLVTILSLGAYSDQQASAQKSASAKANVKAPSVDIHTAVVSGNVEALKQHIAGGKIKTTDYWVSPNIDATNESGLSGLLGGFRYDLGKFGNTWNAFWWSSTETIIPDKVFATFVASGSGSMSHSFIADKFNGYSVRCRRD